VITFKTKRDIHLLDMDSIHNYDEIYKLGIPIPQSEAVKGMDIIRGQ